MTGRVAVYAGAGRPLEIREYPVLAPPPGGMLLRVRQANICGSELHFWRGHGPFAEGQPTVVGHEAVAEIGGLGRYGTALAREGGAGRIVVTDRRPERLALAREFGADVTLNVDETTRAERLQAVQEASNGIGADLALEVAGVPAVLAEGIEM